jgi:hypothetical protein
LIEIRSLVGVASRKALSKSQTAATPAGSGASRPEAAPCTAKSKQATEAAK